MFGHLIESRTTEHGGWFRWQNHHTSSLAVVCKLNLSCNRQQVQANASRFRFHTVWQLLLLQVQDAEPPVNQSYSSRSRPLASAKSMPFHEVTPGHRFSPKKSAQGPLYFQTERQIFEANYHRGGANLLLLVSRRWLHACLHLSLGSQAARATLVAL